MKRSIISKWAVLPVLMMLLVISSCKKDFLDRRPLGRLTDEDITAGTFDSKIFAAYAQLRKGGFNNHLYLGITSYRSDEAMKGSSTSDGSDAELMYDDFQYDKTNGGLQEFWTDHYSLIIATNEIINDIDSIASPDPGTLINRAEAKFLRAYSFFDLVRTFGRVPKIDFKVYEAGDVNIKKVDNESEIFQLIDEDLAEAAGTLPVNWDPPYSEGRLTKGAAMALQARTFLWRSNWAAALGAAEGVIGLNRYQLVSDYGSQFRNTGENGPESIFEIQAFYSPTQDLGIIYSNVQGVRGAGNWDLGWGWNVPTQNLVDEYEEGDPRRIETILYSGQIDPLYGEAVPAMPAIPRPYWNKKVYTDPRDRSSLNNRFGQWMNHRIIRYADVLLMAAEAANELGGADNIQKALGWLEQVRARARGGNTGTLPPVTTTDQGELRQAIRHERFVELAMEEQRFWDLVRWGIDIDVLHAAGKTNYEEKHRLLPIPQAEVDKSGGVLEQNPNY